MANITLVSGEMEVYETDNFVILRQDAGPTEDGGNRSGIYQVWNKEYNVLELETTVLSQAIGLAVQWEMQLTQAKGAWTHMSTGIQVASPPPIAKPN